MIVTMSGAFTFFFIEHYRNYRTQELVRQAELLASLLANGTRLAVFAGDQIAVERATKDIIVNRDVLSISVTGMSGKLLSHQTKDVEGQRHVAAPPAGESEKIDDTMVAVTVPIMAEATQATAGTIFFESGKQLVRKVGSITIVLDKTNVNADIRKLVVLAVSGMVLFLVLGSFLAYLMARGLASPLRALLEGVNAMGSHDVYPSVPVTTEDEIGSLATAFNRMADNLQRRDQEKQQLEEQLRQAREREAQKEWELTFDTVPDLIVILDDERRIVRANMAMAAHLGSMKEELIGKTCQDLRSNCCLLQQFHPPASDNGAAYECEIYDEKNDAWYWLTVSPLRRSEWAAAGTVHVARDITLRRRIEAEKKAMQAKLIQTNKMTSLGLLVSGMAHEVNNPNSNIMFTAHLLARAWKDAESVLDRHFREEGDFRLGGHHYSQMRESLPYHIAGITENARRIEGIIKNLKDFVRKGKADLSPDVDLNRVVSVSASLIGNQIKKYTKCFQLHLADNLPAVRGNAQQLEQVVINVLMNALQALPDKERRVSVTTFVQPILDCVAISIQDEGCGMTPETRASAFEPFFSTKLDSGGTGLGLPISKFILDEHEARMEVVSEPGIGTTVTIFLPALRKKAA